MTELQSSAFSQIEGKSIDTTEHQVPTPQYATNMPTNMPSSTEQLVGEEKMTTTTGAYPTSPMIASPARRTDNGRLIPLPEGISWDDKVNRQDAMSFAEHSNDIYTVQQTIAILISAEWLHEETPTNPTQYVNPYLEYVGYVWSEEENTERKAARDIIIPGTIANQSMESILNKLIGGQFLVELIIQKYMNRKTDKEKEAGENKSEDESEEADDSEEADESKEAVTNVDGGKEDGDDVTKIGDGKEEGKNESMDESEKLPTKDGEGAESGEESDHNEVGNPDEAEVGNPDEAEVPSNWPSGTSDGLICSLLDKSLDSTGYCLRNRTSGKYVVQVSRDPEPIDEPSWSNSYCEDQYKCQWKHCLAVFECFDEHTWSDDSFVVFPWFNTDVVPLLVENGLSASEHRCCYNFMLSVTASDYLVMKTRRNEYAISKERLDLDGDDSDPIVIDVDTNTTGNLSKRDYQKATQHMFLRRQKELNELPHPGDKGARTLVSLASVNDFQRFATMDRDGKDEVDKTVKNTACELLTEHTYHYKDEVTDPDHMRGTNFYTLTKAHWVAMSKRTITGMKRLVQYQTMVPFGTDPTKNKKLGHISIHNVCWGNPYFKMNYLPRGQADCPQVLRNLMPSEGGPPIDYTLTECTMCGLLDPRDGGICDDDNHADGCGRYLTVGELVIPWGEDVRLVRGNTLEIGVWTIECSTMNLMCRVGMVRCVPHQLDMYQNRIGVVSEITELTHEEQLECHQRAHMKERMNNMKAIVNDSLAINTPASKSPPKKKRKNNALVKKERNVPVLPRFVANRLSRWVSIITERFDLDNAITPTTRQKPISDIKCHLSVDGHANIVFTDGMVQLKFGDKVIVK